MKRQPNVLANPLHPSVESASDCGHWPRLDERPHLFIEVRWHWLRLCWCMSDSCFPYELSVNLDYDHFLSVRRRNDPIANQLVFKKFSIEARPERPSASNVDVTIPDIHPRIDCMRKGHVAFPNQFAFLECP